MREIDDRAAIPTADVEPHPRNASMAAEEVARFTTPVSIRIISYRKYRHDTDGCSVKAVLDGLVQAGILRDDSSEFVKEIIFESIKSSDEKTIIEIENAPT